MVINAGYIYIFINGYYSNGSFSGTIFKYLYIYTMNMYNEGLS